jgi:hypothetical protein
MKVLKMRWIGIDNIARASVVIVVSGCVPDQPAKLTGLSSLF